MTAVAGIAGFAGRLSPARLLFIAACVAAVAHGVALSVGIAVNVMELRAYMAVRDAISGAGVVAAETPKALESLYDLLNPASFITAALISLALIWAIGRETPAPGPRRSPFSAPLWFFVPVMCAWMPVRRLRSIARDSSHTTVSPAPALRALSIWWGLWLAFLTAFAVQAVLERSEAAWALEPLFYSFAVTKAFSLIASVAFLIAMSRMISLQKQTESARLMRSLYGAN